jgi:hypothetical protein
MIVGDGRIKRGKEARSTNEEEREERKYRPDLLPSSLFHTRILPMQGQARECMRTKAGATCTGKRFMLIQTRHKVPESKIDGGRGKNTRKQPRYTPGLGWGVVLDN